MDDAVVHEAFAAIFALFGILLAVVGYLLAQKFEGYDLKHQKHFEHAQDMTLHETDRDREATRTSNKTFADQFVRHEEQDNKRFASVDVKLDSIQKDLKEILKVMPRV